MDYLYSLDIVRYLFASLCYFVSLIISWLLEYSRILAKIKILWLKPNLQ